MRLRACLFPVTWCEVVTLIIICPQCGFMRDVPPERLPARSAFATCPQCKNRFHVTLDAPVPTGEDDPLPESAIRPAQRSAGQTSTQNAPAQHGTVQTSPAQLAAMPTAAGGAAPQRVKPSPAPASTAGTASTASTLAGTSPTSASGAASAASAPTPVSGAGSSATPAPQPAQSPQPHAASPVQSPTAQADADISEEDEGSPWDNAPKKIGFVEAFYQTCMQVMFAGSYFFSRLNPAASLMRSLSFFLVLSVAQVLIERLWAEVMVYFLQPSAASDPQLKQLLAMLSSDDGIFFSLLMRTAFMTAELYLTALIFTVFFSFLTRSKGKFGLIFQVTAYAAAPAILCIVPIIGSGVGIIWSVACCVIGCRYALRLHWLQAFGVVLPLYLILLPLMFQVAVKMASFS